MALLPGVLLPVSFIYNLFQFTMPENGERQSITIQMKRLYYVVCQISWWNKQEILSFDLWLVLIEWRLAYLDDCAMVWVHWRRVVFDFKAPPRKRSLMSWSRWITFSASGNTFAHVSPFPLNNHVLCNHFSLNGAHTMERCTTWVVHALCTRMYA